MNAGMISTEAVSFRLVLALAPTVLALHNLEEYPRIVDYARWHGIKVDHAQMGYAVIIATLAPVPVVAGALHYGPGSRAWLAALSLPALLAANAASHVMQSLIVRDLSPGTITGVGLSLPYALYVYRRAAREGHLPRRYLRGVIAGGVLAMPLATLLAQLIGRLLARARRH